MRRGAVRTGRRFARRGAGSALMVVALMGATVLGGPAIAEEDEPQALPPEAQAQFAYPENEIVPDTVFSGVPPQVVCVVFPDFCPEESEELRDPLEQLVFEVDDNDQALPLGPSEEGSLLVSFAGGTPRYAAGVQFELPDIPEGHRYDEFTIQIPQGAFSYAYDSPAFRRVVFGVIATAGSQDPTMFEENLQRALEEEDLASEPVLGIEACPLLVELPEDAEPPRAAPVSSIERENEESEDKEMVLQVECLFGANGQLEDGVWTFRLTSAARAWTDASERRLTENLGIFLRPIGAPNLAFGDADTTTNSQVTLEVEDMTFTVASSRPANPITIGTGSGTQSGGSLATAPTPTTSAPSSSPMRTQPPPTSQEPESPDVAPRDPGEEAPIAAPALASSPGSDPPLVLLVPLFLAGLWLMLHSLTAEVATSTASGGGALTRLTSSAGGATP